MKMMLMTSETFGWSSLLRPLAPAHFTLTTGLFTTYDQTDERFLAEEFLPALLRMDRSANESRYFTVDLDRRLKSLPERLVVVSSTSREVADATDLQGTQLQSGYAWIWRYLRALRVGHDRYCVQHAKLWMMQWVDPADPAHRLLEIVVSSANLTRCSFLDQLQGAWRVCLRMEPQSSKERLKTWGVLPAFLDALGKSTGDDAHSIQEFKSLLGFVTCPENVAFIASVPGKHSLATLRSTPWGAAGLNAVRTGMTAATAVTVMSPFIGEWDETSLSQWCVSAGASPRKLELIWIDTGHRWAVEQRWLLPKSTLEVLDSFDARLLHLPDLDYTKRSKGRFHEGHRQGDVRWSHAKLYRFTIGRRQRILVSSANFSTSAWGRYGADGSLTIQNFELGVCVEAAQWPFDQLGPFADGAEPAVVGGYPNRSQTLISWADAQWDGVKLRIECRCDKPVALLATVFGPSTSREIAARRWRASANKRLIAEVTWNAKDAPPQTVVLACGDIQVHVPVMDVRPHEIISVADLEGVSAQEREEIGDALLLEQYGGAPVEDDPSPVEVSVDPSEVAQGREDQLDQQGSPASKDTYETANLLLARSYLGIVDKWVECWGQCSNSKADKATCPIVHRVLKDGHQLVATLGRQALRDERKGRGLRVGASIAKCELQVRLEGLEI